MVGKAVYREVFEPVVNVGEFLKLLPLKTGNFARVIYIDPAPYTEKDFGAITAGTPLTDKEVTELYQEDTVIGHFRMEPVDKVWITGLKQSKGRPKWTSKKTSFKLVSIQDPVTPPPNLGEIFQYKDTGLFLSLDAPANVATSKIAFYGWLLTIEILETEPDVYTPIPVMGYTETSPGGGK